LTAYKVPESVLVVIFDGDAQVLLLQRSDDPDFWQSVTGAKDDPTESWAHTALREVAEETGIDAQLMGCRLVDLRVENRYALWPQWRHRYAPDVTHNTERVFALQVPNGQAVCMSPREHLAYEWLSATAAIQRCRSATNADAIERVMRMLKAGTL
jgi:dihydroneopterin triphosphate diphosphatase